MYFIVLVSMYSGVFVFPLVVLSYVFSFSVCVYESVVCNNVSLGMFSVE